MITLTRLLNLANKKRSFPLSSEEPDKLRKVKDETREKLMTHNDCGYQTLTRLDYEIRLETSVKVVIRQSCAKKLGDRIIGRRNFSDKWIGEADSV